MFKEVYGWKVFENRVLRGIFRPKGDEMLGSWRQFHNEELCNLYSSRNVIRMTKSRPRKMHELKEELFRILVLKS
jgi:hypothetical protein